MKDIILCIQAGNPHHYFIIMGDLNITLDIETVPTEAPTYMKSMLGK
jgi:hypothetical protein